MSTSKAQKRKRRCPSARWKRCKCPDRPACAPLGEGGALAAQQGGGGVLLFLAGLEVVQINDAQIIALALDAELVLVVGGCGGDHVDVHAAGQHPAMLVVGVVAAKLCAARGRIDLHLPPRP